MKNKTVDFVNEMISIKEIPNSKYTDYVNTISNVRQQVYEIQSMLC